VALDALRLAFLWSQVSINQLLCDYPVSHGELRLWVSRFSLADDDVEDFVGMLVTPIPVRPAILLTQPLEILVPAVPIADINPVGLIFPAVPMMVVVMVAIVVDAIVRAERYWQQAHGRD
jgi:hypothetical protein